MSRLVRNYRQTSEEETAAALSGFPLPWTCQRSIPTEARDGI